MRTTFCFTLILFIFVTLAFVPNSFAQGAADEVISIPDPALAAAVRETLGLAPDTDITQIDMEQLRRFSAYARQIKDLTGLEYAIKMNWVNLSNNQISDITPIAKLTTSLTHLVISNNLIDDITQLKGLVNLRYLYISDNQISDIRPLTGLTNLEELLLNHNQINDIHPLTGMSKLEVLSLSGNQISDINPLEGLTNLEKLSLGGNQISDIKPLEGLTNLEELLLSGNQIKTFNSLIRLTNLEYLYLYNNQISDIRSLAGVTSLKALFISRNQIKDITPLSGFRHLKSLHLAENQISDIKPLEELTNLVNLSLQENQISDVSSLEGLTNLKELRLWRNPIKDRKPLLALLRKNPDVKIYLKYGGEPLPVTLSHFRAEHTDTGVVLKWTTESEVDNAGFYIYRSETKAGEFKIVNPSMIQGAGTTGERNEYTWTDTSAKPNTVYYYRIEDVSHAGVREQLATVRLRGLVSASGKLTTSWADLKMQQ